MNKKVIWIGIASALLIGGGVFWWMRNKNKLTNEPKKEEEGKGTNETTTTTSTTSYDSTGFNQEQGDAFRVWMNKNYPDWRFNGDKLDPIGKPDNSTIRAAYKEFGSAYKDDVKKLAEQINLPNELSKYKDKRFIAKKLINSFTSEYTTKPYIKGGGDGRGNFEQGQYVGVLIDLKKDPLKNKIVAKFKNISSYPKDINDKAMFEFWVNWADVITAI